MDQSSVPTDSPDRMPGRPSIKVHGVLRRLPSSATSSGSDHLITSEGIQRYLNPDDQDLSDEGSGQDPVSQPSRRPEFRRRHILDRIVGNPDLAYMWPQVALQAGSLEVASKHVAGFIRSYMLDHKEEFPLADINPPTGEATIPAAFLPMGNFEEAFRILVGDKNHEICTAVLQALRDAGGNSAVGVDIRPHVSRPLDPSLIGQSAPSMLHFRVRKYLEETAVPRVSLGTRVFDSARRIFENVSTRLYTPALPPGMKRIYWTCVCCRYLAVSELLPIY